MKMTGIGEGKDGLKMSGIGGKKQLRARNCPTFPGK